MTRLWLFFIIFLLSFAASANEINADFKHINHLPFSYTLETRDNIQALLVDKPEWQTNTQGVLNLGQIEGFVWLKFSLKNTSDSDMRLLLSIDNMLLDKVTAYIQSSTNPLVTVDLGDIQPLMKRPIKHEAQLVPIDLGAKNNASVYLQVHHHGALNIPLSLWHPVEYLKYKSKFNLLYGILAGFIIAMALMHLALYSFTKKRFFLFAASLISVIWLLNVHLYGFSYRYIYGNWQWLQQYAQPLLVFVSSLLFIPLLRYGLLQNDIPRIASLTSKHISIVGIIITLGITILPLEIALLSSYLMSILIATSLIVLSCMCRKKPQGYSYIAIVSLLFIALIYQLGFELGLLSGALLDRPITYICYFIVCALLSYTLVSLYIEERDKKIESQQAKLAQSMAEDALLKEKLKIQEQAQEELEACIDERTFELQVTLRELEDKNRELEQMNIEDPLTKVKNRRYFDKRLQMEVRRSRREQSQLSVIMLDIDHFKKINDTHGHLTGDKAICAIANLAKEQLQRSADEIFRYGGEEFVLLLPNTDSQGAYQVAEQIRLATEAFILRDGETEINMTISAGVYSAITSDPKSPHLYTDFADQALYKAKQSGRNQVIAYQP